MPVPWCCVSKSLQRRYGTQASHFEVGTLILREFLSHSTEGRKVTCEPMIWTCESY